MALILRGFAVQSRTPDANDASDVNGTVIQVALYQTTLVNAVGVGDEAAPPGQWSANAAFPHGP